MAIETTSDLSLVGTSQIVDGSVTSAKIGTGAVVAAGISAGAVGSAALASGAVVSSTIAAGAVGSSALASGAVGTAAISSGAATSGQILQANGAGAVTFETPAAGGGMTLIATATPSGATSVSFTSISGSYKHLIVRWLNCTMNNNNGYWGLRVNSDAGSVYSSTIFRKEGAADDYAVKTNQAVWGVEDASASMIPRCHDVATRSKMGYGQVVIYDYADTSLDARQISSIGYGWYEAGTVPIMVTVNGAYGSSGTAITSIEFERQAGSETITGTFFLYGVS
jgi:hypothetical protein